MTANELMPVGHSRSPPSVLNYNSIVIFKSYYSTAVFLRQIKIPSASIFNAMAALHRELCHKKMPRQNPRIYATEKSFPLSFVFSIGYNPSA